MVWWSLWAWHILISTATSNTQEKNSIVRPCLEKKKTSVYWVTVSAHTCDLSIIEINPGRSEIQGHDPLKSKFKFNLGSMRTSLLHFLFPKKIPSLCPLESRDEPPWEPTQNINVESESFFPLFHFLYCLIPIHALSFDDALFTTLWSSPSTDQMFESFLSVPSVYCPHFTFFF